MSAPAPIYLWRLPVNPRAVYAAGRRSRAADDDLGYRLHALFAAEFGAEAPKPFALDPSPPAGQGAEMAVLAYARRPLEAVSPRPSAGVFDWTRAADKRMPDRFPAGLALRFRVATCPIVRVGRGVVGRDFRGLTHPGAEVDAWIAAHSKVGAGPVPDRQAVYLAWLSDQVARSGAATLHEARVAAMRTVSVFRQGPRPAASADKRPSRTFQRPEVTFTGMLAVNDPDRFSEWLARGIGRHRAFGFGMVLLAPA